MRSLIGNIFILLMTFIFVSADSRLEQLEKKLLSDLQGTTGQGSCGCSQLKQGLEEFKNQFTQMSKTLEQLSNKAETCGPKCPYGWVAFRDSCYLFWNSTSISFAKAAEICQQNGAHPVFVETAEENSFLKDYLRQMKAAFWWIGMTDQETEGTWKWYGTNNVVQFTDWNEGEPNGGSKDNCAHFFSWFNYTWNDIWCNGEKYTFYAICEKQSC